MGPKEQSNLAGKRRRKHNFFQYFSEGRTSQNTIWGLRDGENEEITSFEGLEKLGVNHFKTLFKTNNRVTIVEIIRLS